MESDGPATESGRALDRTIVRLALPALATLAVEPLYVLTDTAIVGHLGTAPLGGLALAATVLNISFLVFNFLAYGTTARVAFRTGAGDTRGAAVVAVQGLWLALVLGVVMGSLVAAGARPVGALLGGKGAVLDAAVTYLRISAVAAPLVLVALVGNGYLRGVQDLRTPLRVVVVANLLNVVVEVVLVYGLDTGVAGSAWGTVLAQAVAATWFLAILARRLTAAGASLRPDVAEIVGLARFGSHLVVRTAALLGTHTLSVSVAARMGASTLAAHQIALQIETFLALVVDGLAIAGQTLTGAALGRRDVRRARATGRRLVRLGLLTGAALAVLVVATSGLVPIVFSPDAAVRSRATAALVVIGLLQIPAAVVFVLDGVLIGASDSRQQQWSNVAAFLVFVPCAIALLRWRDAGIVGVWLGLTAWMTARLVANVLRFSGNRWEKVVTSAP